MALFPRSFITNDQSAFPPIFRLLDEFDQYSRSNDRSERSPTKSFIPKFDIQELKDAYQLHGELPGIDQKDVEIEFTDASTLTIKGRSERSYSHGPGASKGAISDGTGAGAGAGAGAGTSNDKNSVQTKGSENGDASDKYWVMERNVGEFSRSFGFPTQIDQDAVKASMKNGILSIVVPKAKKQEGRKIMIQ
ncbi:30 kDa heat shock protein [Golovinomyces cichoracearum]|uniref:30 kDa heat shock protein n=1 Tax=Golovinomyces cichoracearum TaxID=62708 RepID=A0A420HZB1_9PEZI|nr:30 kDa heat shock protein [Golovinomyces cichoracearum]